MPHDDISQIEDYPQSRRFVLVRFNAIKLCDARRYLVKGLIPREGIIVVWGPPKCGKSFWTFDLAMYIALGWEYRGRRVEAGTVVYIACEGEAGLAARKEAFQQAKIAEDGADPAFYLLTTRLDLVNDVNDLIQDVAGQLPDRRCSAIVVDTLNRSLTGSESRDEDMAAYIQAADRLREIFHCAVIIIHHCGINGDRPRGHTSLTGAADAQIAVKRDKGGSIISKVEWMKDGDQGDEIASRLETIEVGVDEDGEPITSCVVRPDDEALDKNRRTNQQNLPAAQRRALQLLVRAIDKDGEMLPTGGPIPPNTKGTTYDRWRRDCEAGGITPTDTTDAKRVAFARATMALITAGRIERWDPWVWIKD